MRENQGSAMRDNQDSAMRENPRIDTVYSRRYIRDFLET